MPQQAAPVAPWQTLYPKQVDLFNCFKHIVLASGARLAGKTRAVLARVVRHMWETPSARVGVFAKSKTLAKDGGSWNKLITEEIPRWTRSGLTGESDDIQFGFTTFNREGVPGPKTDANTRTNYFGLRNWHGSESTAMLFSIEHDHEVIDKCKNREFSMVWVIELSSFKDPSILAALMFTLRLEHLQPEPGQPDTKRMFIADTNPDEDEGADSWIYQLFWEIRNKRPDPNKILNDEEKQAEAFMERYRNMIAVFEYFQEDNPTISEDQRALLWVLCQNDPTLHDSWFYGVWGLGKKQIGKHFATTFIREVHVIGGGPDEGDQIDISPSSTILYTGWDIGAVNNHSALIIDKWWRQEDGCFCFSILDEHVSLKENITIIDYADAFMEKLQEIEKHAGKKFDLISWSDDTAVNVWRPSGGTYDANDIYRASRQRLQLQGVSHKDSKSEGGVEARVRLVQRLLKRNRIFVSARCVAVIEMFLKLRRGDKYYVAQDKHKHVFDALSYLLYQETMTEMFDLSTAPTATERGVSVG